MAITTSTALLIGAAVTAASTGISLAVGRPDLPSAPSVPDTPLSDPVKTQAELDITARAERVKRARLSQGAGGTRSSPLGLPGSIGTQATLPKLTGQ